MQIIILTIDDDGRTRAYSCKHVPFMERGQVAELSPVRSGDDRGHYDVFEVAGVSIDVMRMRTASLPTNCRYCKERRPLNMTGNHIDDGGLPTLFCG